MIVVRVLAGLALLVAAIALVSDATRTLSGTAVVMTSLAAHWKALAPQGLAAAQAMIARNLHPAVWDQVLVRIMALPTWFVFATVGIVAGYFGRRQRRVNIYAN